MNKVLIKYHCDDIDRIKSISKGNWVDLRAAETVALKAGEDALISLGVSMKLPEGYEAHLAPRSSTYGRWGVIQTNGIGIIDNSYSGDNDIWCMPVHALRDTIINKNDRICQFRLFEIMSPVGFEDTDHLDSVDRGGFGSTGEN